MIGKWLARVFRWLPGARTRQALQNETAFRRAMENAMTIGLRVLDLRGRITYVNAAFCQMTGWREDELVGQSAPFPYWVTEDYALDAMHLAHELSGKTDPHRGIQLRIRRKDGTLLDARIYVSPLLDANRRQTGWLGMMTDITVQAGIRRELAIAQERFLTVLGALDAAVSVAPLGSEEVLYANRQYRLWFGDGVTGHLTLLEHGSAAQTGPHDHRADKSFGKAGVLAKPLAENPENLTEDNAPGYAEVWIERLGRWLEVRARYLTWVDGRIARIVIATDVTAHRQAELQAAAQAERAQAASRLIVMGEMVSSVAHELNQPLTAISNYCHGISARIKTRGIGQAELLATLGKTAHQAQRAGQVIGHIRSFIKRSEPNRQWTRVETMVEQAVELADIALRRSKVNLTWSCASDLPQLFADPILIEQVLLNLLKNGAESVDAAQRPLADRRVNLQASTDDLDGQPTVRFTVSDTGGGLAPQVQARLYETFFSTKSDGLGIGLSLCRSIVESHQGRIAAENLYNGSDITGCQFTVWIPSDAPAKT